MNYLDINLGTLKVSGKNKENPLWYWPLQFISLICTKRKERKAKKGKWFTLIKWNMYSKGNNT